MNKYCTSEEKLFLESKTRQDIDVLVETLFLYCYLLCNVMLKLRIKTVFSNAATDYL